MTVGLFNNNPFSVKRIGDALADQVLGEKLLALVIEKIRFWLEDGSVDDSESQDLDRIEKQFRVVLSEALPDEFNREEQVRKLPGFHLTALGWLLLASLQFSLHSQLNPVRVARKFKEISQDAIFPKVVSFFLPVLDLHDWLPPHLLALAIWSSPSGQSEKWREYLLSQDGIGGPYAEMVSEKLSDYIRLEEHSKAVYAATPSMGRYIRTKGASEFFRDFLGGASESFKNQKLLASFDLIESQSLSKVLVLFGDNSIGIFQSKLKPVYLAKESFRVLLIGTSTHRKHQGFGFTDFPKLSFDFYGNSGSAWNFTMELNTDPRRAHSERQEVSRKLGKVAEIYPVSTSGNHEFTEGGYVSSVSVGIIL